MQKEFCPVVEELEYQCKNYFSERLLAAFLHGSIDKWDAVPGVSDLDYLLIISDLLREDDKLWIRNMENILQSQYSVVDEVHLAVHSVDELKTDGFALFCLKYNATLCFGADVTKIPALSECEIYQPDRNLAKSRLSFAKKCFSDALEHIQPACTGEIPSNSYYAARKFARYFVVIEGAYFLMALGKFQSFDKKDIMAGLRENTKGFDKFLDVADMVLCDPIKAGIIQDDFLRQAQPFVEWMFEQIETL